jgi:hypothetical protein
VLTLERACAMLCTPYAVFEAAAPARRAALDAPRGERPMQNPTGKTSEHRDVATMIEGAREQIGDVTERARRAVAKADRTLSDKMQENPLLVLGIAVGVGYVIGRVFSRYR